VARPDTALFQTFLTGSHNVKVYQTCFADSNRYARSLEFDQIDTILASALLAEAIVQRIRAQISCFEPTRGAAEPDVGSTVAP
jgi:hypothetical protein